MCGADREVQSEELSLQIVGCAQGHGSPGFDWSRALWQQSHSLAFLLKGVKVLPVNLGRCSLSITMLHPTPKASIHFINVPSQHWLQGLSQETFLTRYKLSTPIHTHAHAGISHRAKYILTQSFKTPCLKLALVSNRFSLAYIVTHTYMHVCTLEMDQYIDSISQYQL